MNWTYVDELIECLLRLKTRKDTKDFLMGILTPKELQEIPTRLQIVKMLKRRIPQYQIAEKLKVGVGTITRGSNEIKKGRFKQI
ncbi:MAG: Trp family transcriptional regulator [bacterium]|nr:Trp family transcriptional regulator [bacterium]